MGKVVCLNCHGVVPKLSGVICTNFGLDCGPGKPVCLNGWHGC